MLGRYFKGVTKTMYAVVIADAGPTEKMPRSLFRAFPGLERSQVHQHCHTHSTMNLMQQVHPARRAYVLVLAVPHVVCA